MKNIPWKTHIVSYDFRLMFTLTRRQLSGAPPCTPKTFAVLGEPKPGGCDLDHAARRRPATSTPGISPSEAECSRWNHDPWRIHVCHIYIIIYIWFAIYHRYTPVMLAYVPYIRILWDTCANNRYLWGCMAFICIHIRINTWSWDVTPFVWGSSLLASGAVHNWKKNSYGNS